MSKRIPRKYFVAAVGTYIIWFLLWDYASEHSLMLDYIINIERRRTFAKLEDTSDIAKPKNAQIRAVTETFKEDTSFNNSVRPTKHYFETKSPISARSRKFFLTEILMVRIYKHDLAKWTTRELKQWLHFLFYAGVEHVYVCDHFIHQNESLKSILSKYTEKGLLTYIAWPWNASINGGDIMKHQVNCYGHVIQKFGNDSIWQTSIDMDEFPVCLKDTNRLFLARYLLQQPTNVSQILMPNFLMLGQGNRYKTMTIERITRMTNKEANHLTKPLYRVSAILEASVHSHRIKSGLTITANNAELRMFHYWGARLQNWGPDTEKTFEGTEEVTLVRDHIAPAIRRDLSKFDEDDAFSNVTGP